METLLSIASMVLLVASPISGNNKSLIAMAMFPLLRVVRRIRVRGSRLLAR